MTQPHIIVLGNEKGGTGKTTLSIHIATSLLHQGYKVATIDIDARQRSFSEFLENRRDYMIKHQVNLPFPNHYIIHRSELDSKGSSEAQEEKRFRTCIERAAAKNDIILIDAPGNDTPLSRIAHSYADTIITPLNDSFIDLSLLAKVKEDNLDMRNSGVYSSVIWDAKKKRAKRDLKEINWVVVRNRLSNLDARNKRNMAEAVEKISKRLGCKIADGLNERVIYRELYLQGLSLPDIVHKHVQMEMRLSHVAARQELRQFIEFLTEQMQIEEKVAA